VRRVSTCLILLCFLLWAGFAQAQEVALARTPGDQRIANRISAELSALGFNVYVVAQSSSSEVLSLRQIAAARGAIVGLRASPSKTGIELWIADPNTGATAFEEVVTVDSGRNDELLALRAVEVLRARLLKLGVQSGPVAEQVPPQPSVESRLPATTPAPIPRAATPLLWVALGLSYTYHPSPLSDQESAHLGLTVAPDPRWSLGAFTLLSIRKAELDHEFGSASANSTMFGLAADAHLFHDWFSASLGAGAALVRLDVVGRAQPPLEAQQHRLFAALPFLRAGATATLSDRVRVRADLLAGFSAPKTTIRLNDEDAATWGRPLFIATFSVQLAVLSLQR
jgi:hypothetical protein